MGSCSTPAGEFGVHEVRVRLPPVLATTISEIGYSQVVLRNVACLWLKVAFVRRVASASAAA